MGPQHLRLYQEVFTVLVDSQRRRSHDHTDRCIGRQILGANPTSDALGNILYYYAYVFLFYE